MELEGRGLGSWVVFRYGRTARRSAGRQRPAGRGGGERGRARGRLAGVAVPAWRPSRARAVTAADSGRRSWGVLRRALEREGAVLRDATNGHHDGRIVDLGSVGQRCRGTRIGTINAPPVGWRTSRPSSLLPGCSPRPPAPDRGGPGQGPVEGGRGMRGAVGGPGGAGAPEGARWARRTRTGVTPARRGRSRATGARRTPRGCRVSEPPPVRGRGAVRRTSAAWLWRRSLGPASLEMPESRVLGETGHGGASAARPSASSGRAMGPRSNVAVAPRLLPRRGR